MDFAHLHLMFNHVPVVGVVLGSFVLLWGALRRSKDVVSVGLVTMILTALVAIPVYLTGETAEEMVEVRAVGPVRPDLELREVARPMAQPELPGRLERLPGVQAEVREPALPCLESPVAPVGHGAAGHEPRELRARVPPARVDEAAGERPAIGAPATRVVDMEGDLPLLERRMAGVDRAPREDRPLLALGAIADERPAFRVDAQRDVLRVARDQLRRLGARRHTEGGEEGNKESDAPHRRLDRQHGRKDRALA